MSGLLDSLVNNPELAQSIANEVGINTNEASTIIAQLAPILMAATRENLKSSRDSGPLLKQIQDTQLAKMVDEPQKAINSADFGDIGNIILGQLTGSKENSRKVAKHVQNETGISDMIIKKILPMIAPFVIASLSKKAAPNINNQQSSAGGGLEDILVSMIDKDHDGSIIDDMMSMAMKYFS